MRERFRFGQFEFELSTSTLSREGIRVKLQPQPARVLAILVERAGDVVTRDELRQAIWSDGTFVDFERGLNFCIAQIRSALGDSAESPRYIETLPKRGYRFIAPVRDETPVNAPMAAVATGARPSRRFLLAGIATAAIGAVFFAAVVARRGAPGSAPVRIAVVPFDNESGGETLDAVARGVADATVARLATPERIGHLSVIGNSAALRRPRSFRDLKVIGDELGAEFVVLAQVRRDESRVRLVAHLIRVSDEVHVWAQTFDRPAFTLEVQAEIAEAIASAVASRLIPRDRPLTAAGNVKISRDLPAHI